MLEFVTLANSSVSPCLHVLVPCCCLLFPIEEQETMKLRVLVSVIITIIVVTLLSLDGYLTDPHYGSRRKLRNGKDKGGDKGGNGHADPDGGGKRKKKRGEVQNGGDCKESGFSCESGQCCLDLTCAPGPDDMLTCQTITIPPIAPSGSKKKKSP